jgi:adenylyltransferase/sulfurtransferase
MRSIVFGSWISVLTMIDTHTLSTDELHRYSRHLLLPNVGIEGQAALKRASVLLVGAGGLGSPAALYLAAAGVGHLGLVDFDDVDASNLQRQILYGTSMLGQPKIESAQQRLRDLNPFVEVTPYATRLTSANALEIIRPYDIVLDGSDNFATRYLVNDACVLLGKPYIYGSIFRFEGQASVFATQDGPCYRCLYPEPPPPGLVPSCAEGGVLGVLPGIVGSIQANEVMKLIIGIGEPLVGRLLLFDALAMRFNELKLRKRPDCRVCGKHPTITELIDYDAFCGAPKQDTLPGEHRITPRELAGALHSEHPPLIIDVREPREWEIAHLAEARLVPLATLPTRMDELPKDTPIVVHCKSGARSARATEQLRAAGFQNVRSLEGGILRWAEEVDPTLSTY